MFNDFFERCAPFGLLQPSEEVRNADKAAVLKMIENENNADFIEKKSAPTVIKTQKNSAPKIIGAAAAVALMTGLTVGVALYKSGEYAASDSGLNLDFSAASSKEKFDYLRPIESFLKDRMNEDFSAREHLSNYGRDLHGISKSKNGVTVRLYGLLACGNYYYLSYGIETDEPLRSRLQYRFFTEKSDRSQDHFLGDDDIYNLNNEYDGARVLQIYKQNIPQGKRFNATFLISKNRYSNSFEISFELPALADDNAVRVKTDEIPQVEEICVSPLECVLTYNKNAKKHYGEITLKLRDETEIELKAGPMFFLDEGGGVRYELPYPIKAGDVVRARLGAEEEDTVVFF